jgi:hypothetical protein
MVAGLFLTHLTDFLISKETEPLLDLEEGLGVLDGRVDLLPVII